VRVSIFQRSRRSKQTIFSNHEDRHCRYSPCFRLCVQHQPSAGMWHDCGPSQNGQSFVGMMCPGDSDGE
jgi:hypothetical protein